MSDPREAVEKAIASRKLIEQLEVHEARQRQAVIERQKQDAAKKKEETRTLPAMATSTVPPDDVKPLVTAPPSVTGEPRTTTRTSSPRTMGGPKQRKIDTNLVNVANTLYEEAGFTEKTRLDQKPVTPTFKQIKARLGLVIIEPILGGTQEALFPFAQSVATGRPATSVLRITGAIATPTAADFVAGWLLAKTGATKAGQKIIKKLANSIQNIDDPFKFPTKATEKALDELWDFEVGLTRARRLNQAADDIGLSLIEQQKLSKAIQEALDSELPMVTKKSDFKFISDIIDDAELDLATRQRLAQRVKTSVDLEPELPLMTEKFKEDALTTLRRTVKNNPGVLDNIEDMAEYYEKNPAQFSAGASVIPEEVFIFNKIAYDLDMDAYDLVNFITRNADLFADGTLLAALIPTLSTADAIIVIEGTTLIPEPEIDDLVERMRQKTWSRQISRDLVTPISETEQEQTPTVLPGETTLPTQTQKQAQSQTTSEPLLEETILDEPMLVPSVPTVPFVLKSKKRRKLNLKLFRGPKRKYRVQHKYTDGTKTTVTVQAQSHPEAVAKAEGNRNRSKRLKEAISEEA